MEPSAPHLETPSLTIASVLLPLPLGEAYDYLVPDGMSLAPGDLVSVPLGPRTLAGAVTEVRQAPGSNRRLREVLGRLDAPSLPPRTLEFLLWAAAYGVEAPGAALAICLRALGHPRPSEPERLIAAPDAVAATPARARVLEAARTPARRSELAAQAGVSSGVVSALIAAGALVRAPPSPPPQGPPPGAGSAPVLAPSQAAAAQALTQAVRERRFGVWLLDGVTGSGKTEVYMEAAAAALAESPDAQVLVLMPEIALTEGVLQRLTDRFGQAPSQWHSDIPGPRRRATWEAVAQGRERLVVGARSALFLPFRDLRLVIVDEEHDGSYKQEEGFIYQARDMAVARGRIEQAMVVLASATPSLETIWNARSGRYRSLRLDARHGEATLPEISLVDLRVSPPPPGRWLSPVAEAAVVETLGRGEQALLFLNRRGYAPLVVCRACGEPIRSPDTAACLVEHRYSRRLVCHVSGFSMPKPDRCPTCGAKESLVSVGPGVERVEEEARSLFPDARIAVFSSDTAPDARSARALILAMQEGEIDVLVATQAAAKGHNFPRLTLSVVVDADVGLRGGDLRAAERTFQLITQVAGRAGRADRPGSALVQTWTPDHAVLQAIARQDRDGFVALELAERELLGLPPFGRLAAVILSSPRPDAVEAFALEMAACAPNAPGVAVYGPADPPLALLRGRRRKRLLVRADRGVDLQGFLRAWRERCRPPSAVRVVVDVDPYSFH